MIEYKHNPSLENDFEDKKIGKGVWSPSALPDTHKSIEEFLPNENDLQKVGDHYWGGDYVPSYYELNNLKESYKEIMLPKMIAYAQQQVQEKVEADRARIKKEITEQTLLNDGSDTFVKLGEALWVCDSKEDREKFISTLHSKRLEDKKGSV